MIAAGQDHADGFGLFRGRGRSRIIGRDQRAGRPPGPAPPRCRSRRKRRSAGPRCRRRRRRKTDRRIFRCSSRPCRPESPTASPHSAPPAAPAPGRNRAAPSSMTAHSPPSARSGNPAGRDEIMRGVVTEGRSSTRRVSRMISFRPKYPADNASATGTLDVGGEYAVYMMPETARTPVGTGLSDRFGRSFRPPNLDAPPLSPYTSAVPEMDVNLNPRAAPP